jgi:Rod binding domain-containing protein
MLEVAEEHLAQVLASQGGLGLANLIVQGLSGKP